MGNTSYSGMLEEDAENLNLEGDAAEAEAIVNADMENGESEDFTDETEDKFDDQL